MARQPKDYDIQVVRVAPHVNAQLVRTGPTTAVPDAFSSTCYIDEGRLSVIATVSVAPGGQPRIVELMVHAGPRAPEGFAAAITTTSLRRILVDQVLKAVVNEATTETVEEPADAPGVGVKGRADAAARHYLDAQASGSTAPTEAVALALGVSRSQASRYVREARHRGLLASPGQIPIEDVPHPRTDTIPDGALPKGRKGRG